MILMLSTYVHKLVNSISLKFRTVKFGDVFIRKAIFLLNSDGQLTHKRSETIIKKYQDHRVK